MAWWIIPLLATLAAAVWTRVGSWSVGRIPPKPAPGSQADLADLAKFAAALDQPWIGRPEPRLVLDVRERPDSPAGPAGTPARAAWSRHELPA